MAEQRVIDWHPSDRGGSLGRHVQHDDRSRAYRFSADLAPTPQSVTHRRLSPILDQDLQITYQNVSYNGTGSCTGNASVGALGSEPLNGTTGAPELDEQLALNIYSAATYLDGFGDPFPSNDRGSSGLAVAKVCQQMGFISGYQHCFSLDELIAALQVTPVIVGTNWYDSMDAPDNTGVVQIASGASIRGGHEYECIGVNVDSKMLEFVNSWGSGWGVGGHFFMSYDTFGRLLSEQGDVTVFVPKTSVPTPTPTPPPTPAPTPTPTPGDVDDLMWQHVRHFIHQAEAWARSKGFK